MAEDSKHRNTFLVIYFIIIGKVLDTLLLFVNDFLVLSIELLTYHYMELNDTPTCDVQVRP